MSTPYELLAPTKWAMPPQRFSFSSLQAIAACPRRWQLVHSEWGTHSRFPERTHPSAIEGQIVHEALDLLSRALGRVGRPPLGSTEFQAAVVGCGFWEFFEKQVDECNSLAARHPKAGPGFVIRTPPRELANRAVRLFREQYRPGGHHSSRAVPGTSPSGGPVLSQLQHHGALSEVPLQHPTMPLAGILDLVTLDGDSAVTVVDFKTGAAKESHRYQLFLYAMLWWRATGMAPARVEVQYLNDDWEETVAAAELDRVERRVGEEISGAMEAIALRPGPARSGPGCARCPVRARCDEGWPHVESGAALSGRTADCEVTVISAPAPTGFTGRRRDGRELPVVYEMAVGKALPPLTIGTRLRLVDAVPTGEGKALELRAWSECYIL